MDSLRWGPSNFQHKMKGRPVGVKSGRSLGNWPFNGADDWSSAGWIEPWGREMIVSCRIFFFFPFFYFLRGRQRRLVWRKKKSPTRGAWLAIDRAGTIDNDDGIFFHRNAAKIRDAGLLFIVASCSDFPSVRAKANTKRRPRRVMHRRWRPDRQSYFFFFFLFLP